MKKQFFAILGIILLTLTLFTAQPASPALASTYNGYTLEQARNVILNEVNVARTSAGLAPVRMTVRLNNIAQNWSATMASQNSMYHNPNYSNQYPAGWYTASENVAAGYTVDNVVDAWLGSPGHRANILRSNSNYLGIGVAATSTGRLYFTQNFAGYSSTPSDVITGTNPPDSTFTPTVNRLSGADRFATAVSISTQFTAGVPVVYVANGLNFPDALVASAAAATLGGPLLLTTPTSLPATVATEIRRLNPSQIIVVGGTASVSEAVYNQLRTIQPNIRRDAGPDRYSTSLIINKNAFTEGSNTAFIVTGQNFPDSLAASSAAGMLQHPIFLVPSINPSSALPTSVRVALTEMGVTRVYIVGGVASVSSTIESNLRTLLGSSNVTRLSGADRYATSVATNAALFPSATRAFLASGQNYPDALGGAAFAGGINSPLYLIPPTCVPRSVVNDMKRLGVTQVTLLGGNSTLNTDVANLRICL